MNICIIFSTQFPPREGIGNYVYNMSKKFIEKGHDVTLITRGDLGGNNISYENLKIFRPRFVPCYPFHVHVHGFFVDNVFKKLENKFDIVNIHTPLSPTISTHLPIISTVHTPARISTRNFESTGIFSYLSKAQSMISYMLEDKLLERSDMITTVSNSVTKELIEEYRIKKEIKTIYNGVDETLFVPNNNKENEKRYILYVGSLTYRKGLFDLIICGKDICDKYKDINFVIVGDGILRKELQKKVEHLNIKNRFIFKGHVPKTELIKLYQNATVQVIPSHYEGLPTVLLEGMACGLSVVATAVCGNLDVIKSNDNGILVNSKSAKDLTYAISILLEDDKMRKEIGKKARSTIEQEYTWDIISNRLLECYYSLIK